MSATELDKVKTNLKDVKQRLQEYHRSNEQFARDLKTARDEASYAEALAADLAAEQAAHEETKKALAVSQAAYTSLNKQYIKAEKQILAAQKIRDGLTDLG